MEICQDIFNEMKKKSVSKVTQEKKRREYLPKMKVKVDQNQKKEQMRRGKLEAALTYLITIDSLPHLPQFACSRAANCSGLLPSLFLQKLCSSRT